jgi:hypothetical protein
VRGDAEGKADGGVDTGPAGAGNVALKYLRFFHNFFFMFSHFFENF